MPDLILTRFKCVQLLQDKHTIHRTQSLALFTLHKITLHYITLHYITLPLTIDSALALCPRIK